MTKTDNYMLNQDLKTIIVSAINLREGGGLTILNETLKFLSESSLSKKYNIVALVHNKNLCEYPNINYIDFPKSASSYFYRLYYEYFYFKRLSKKLKPYLWLSLHDITPNVKAERKAVYMHNPSVFNKIRLSDFKFDKTYILFSLFYKYLYKINVRKNNYCIVQQKWLKEGLGNALRLPSNKFIVAKPEGIPDESECKITVSNKKPTKFFFPSLPRPFKNFEVICKAAGIIWESGIKDIKFYLTLDGSENAYSKWIYEKYKSAENINFLGLLPKEKMERFYEEADALVFPSRLETWGLPISEFKTTGKPMILADLPYAKETAEGARQVAYFNSEDANQLAELVMELYQNEKKNFHPQAPTQDENVLSGYHSLFKKLLE